MTEPAPDVAAGLDTLITPLLRRAVPAHLGATELVVDAELGWSDREQGRFAVGNLSDALARATPCSTRWPGGPRSRFVLSTSGHIAPMVTPPGNWQASWRVSADTSADPEHRLRTASTEFGSWWPTHFAWLGERSGGTRDAPPELGGRRLHARTPAPGEYVR